MTSTKGARRIGAGLRMPLVEALIGFCVRGGPLDRPAPSRNRIGVAVTCPQPHASDTESNPRLCHGPFR